jgi:hypothetical protein
VPYRSRKGFVFLRTGWRLDGGRRGLPIDDQW